MPIPATAKRFTDSMDPADTVDYLINVNPLLEAGEAADTVTFSVTADAAALGFGIVEDAPYAPSEPTPGNVMLWVAVDIAQQGASIWNGEGAECAIEFTITTNSNPPRILQRSVAIRVKQL